MRFYNDMRFVLILIVGLFSSPAVIASECVVLLHGIHLNNTAMVVIERSLKKSGYSVVNHHYRSTKASIDVLSNDIHDAVARCGDTKVNFVTHSMGGILLRNWMRLHRPRRMGRVVMLGPPNKGSELADILGDLYAYKFVLGPAGQELGTKGNSTPVKLGPANFELGVIAGNKSLFPHFSTKLPGPDDGIVSVHSTKLAGMKDHIVLPVSHVLMLVNAGVIRQTKAFLRSGRFLH